jgi:hypothetical protein
MCEFILFPKYENNLKMFMLANMMMEVTDM